MTQQPKIEAQPDTLEIAKNMAIQEFKIQSIQSPDRASDDSHLTDDEIEIKKVKDPKLEPGTKPKGPSLYALFVLAAVTAVRTCYVVNKNSIGYAYGFQGDGFKANNPTYML